VVGGGDTLHIGHPTPGGHTIPGYTGQPMLPGCTWPAHGCTGWSALQHSDDGCTVKVREAQFLRNPWVGGPGEG